MLSVRVCCLASFVLSSSLVSSHFKVWSADSKVDDGGMGEGGGEEVVVVGVEEGSVGKWCLGKWEEGREQALSAANREGGQGESKGEH